MVRIRRRELCLSGSVIAAAVYPAWLTWHEQGIVAPFRFFAADAFYFLAVADHSQGRPFYTFDGQFATNGFQPLWQFLITMVSGRTDAGPPAQLLLAYGLGVVLVALGAALFSTAVLRTAGNAGLALLAAVPGFYYLLLPAVEPQQFAVWSYANGMESGLSVLAFGVLARLLVDRRLGLPEIPTCYFALLGLTATFVTLARLDDVFLFAPLFLLAATSTPSLRTAWPRILALGLPAVLGIGAYLAYNLTSSGLLMPVSGAVKNEGLAGLLRNGYATLTTFAPYVDLFGRGTAVWDSEAWRVLQMLVPAAAAALLLTQRLLRDRDAPRARRLRESLRAPLVLLSLYVILKATYNFCFVRLWHQGHWYFPLSIFVFSWIVADAVARCIEGGTRRFRTACSAICVFVVLLYANAFADQKRRGEYGLANHDFWQRSREIDAALESRCPGCGVVEFDDGILSYSLRRSVMSGLGFTLDREGVEASRRGELLQLAYARGFNLLATLHYPMAPDAYRDPDSLRAALKNNVQLRGQRLDDFDFSVLYTDPKSRVHFVAFAPRAVKAEH